MPAPSHSRCAWSRTLLVAVMATVTLAACAAGDEADEVELGGAEQAIYYGTRSPTVTNLSAGEVTAIGYVADASGSPFCSATLIDRDVAVTARHCVEGTIAVDRMRFGMGNPNSPNALIRVHSAPYHRSMDVALLFLQEDAVSRVPSADPLPIMRETPSPSLVGTRVEAAGYGQTHDDSVGLYFVALDLTAVGPEYLVVNGRGRGGICFGDSGGPLFVHVGNGDPVIAGVESHGESSCVGEDFLTRLDLAQGWIDSEMAAFDPSSPPQTGTQGGDSCLPDGDGWAPVGQEQKCVGFGLCSASPTTSTGLGFAFLVLVGLALLRRRSARL
jgi:uncharacterized protein (TIGR03382 family)